MKTLLLLCVMLLPTGFTNASESMASMVFPGKRWERLSLREAGILEDKFLDFKNYVFKEGKEFKTHSLVVVKDGYLIFDESNENFSSKKPHRLWSITKSITSALIGILESKKLLNRDDYIYNYYKGQKGFLRGKLKIKDLLHMSSGIDWHETFPKNRPLDSDAVKVLYTNGQKNMPSYVLSKKQRYLPGTKYNYSTGDTMVLSGLFNKVLEGKDQESFPWSHLFDKIGATTFVFEKDGASNFAGGSYGYISALDLARFGHLYLNKGRWKDKQVIPKKWVEFSLMPAPVFDSYKYQRPTRVGLYGANWKLALEYPKRNVLRLHPSMTSDIFFAAGHHGQYLFVIPSKNMIMVRTGSDINGSGISIDKMIKLLLLSVENENE